MRVTIKDVARQARVSIKTVSRVLNKSPQVSERTREAVMQAIRELNFRPNAMARGLVLGTSMSVGLIIADITNPFFPEVVRGVEDAASRHNYNVVLCNSDENPTKEAQYLDLLLEKQVDGIILIGSRVPEETLISLAQDEVPIVVVNRDLKHPRLGSVAVRNLEKGCEAVTHLAGLGRRRIAHITGSRLSESSRERLEGYKRGLELCGLPLEEGLVAPGAPTREGGFVAMSRLLMVSPRPDGVFAYNDLQAIGAIDAIKKAGLAVPGDISVVGYDDIELATFCSPPLTTFHMPKYEMGYKAMNMLIRMIKGETAFDPRIEIMPRLVIRESCGGCPERSQ